MKKEQNLENSTEQALNIPFLEDGKNLLNQHITIRWQ